MLKLWQDPQLRILLILNLAAISAIFIFIMVWIFMRVNLLQKKRMQEQKDAEKFKKFADRFKEKNFPAEISLAFEEIHEEMIILEESMGERFNTFLALANGIEEKFKLMENANRLSDQKLALTLQDILIKLKRQSRKLVEKHADNLFGKLKRLEEELGGIEERMVVVETFMEAQQMLRSQSTELSTVGEEDNGDS